MKKLVGVLLCIAMLASFFAVGVLADFSQASIAISCEEGKIIVNGSFESVASGENYRVILANFNENGGLKRVLGISDLTAIESGTNKVDYSVDIPDLMADKEPVKAYILTDKLEPICVPAEKMITSLKVLALGSSFNIDSTRQLYYIAEDAGIDNIVVANIYNGSSTLQEHTESIVNNTAKYEYWKNSTGDWLMQSNKSILDGILDENWNIFVLNQGALASPDESTYQGDGEEGYLTKYINYINENKTNPDARLAWNTAWAIDNDYNTAGGTFIEYGGKQAEMYQNIVNAVNKHVVPLVEDGTFDLLIPSGTAMQNVRTSFIGDNLSREDNVHASENQGRYTAALTLFKCITGQSIDNLSYVPKICDDVMITPNRHLAIKEAVNNAVAKPLEITESKYKDASLASQDYHPMVDAPEGVKLNFNQMTAAASSTTTSADLAIDGDGATSTSRWTSYLGVNKADGPHSLTIDLKSVRKISDIGIKWFNSDNRHYYFAIEVSTDGKTFTPVQNLGLYNPDSTKSVQGAMLQSKTTADIQYFTLNNAEARYIRYWGHGNDYKTSALNYNHILELEVYLQPESVSSPYGTEITDVTNETAAGDDTETVTLDLGAVKTVSDIGVAWENSSTTQYDFTIEVSTDGDSYTPVKDFTSALADGMQYFNIVNADAQFIRYTGDKGVSDIKVYQQTELPPEPGNVETPTGTLLEQEHITIYKAGTEEETSFPAENALDGDSKTYWRTNVGSVDPMAKSITFDLKEIKTVSDIGIEWLKSDRNYYFCIQVSTDGSSWSYVDNMGTADSKDTMINSGKKLTAYYSLGNVKARYIKYTGLGNSSSNAAKYNQVCEFNVYLK